ncbi:TetR/AcrR family transcriptional regulator [Anoxybacterium hadale]|uniref:TetR/AcrR family transcriptional regulator n=1 Tax=Anoxybacterium hadale TaxID=3408580 RepID=A0ACD1AFL8_9FIRM|nr:TetR/AcrR family transcriptional regulator [Clostridiales bacterium]
MKEKSFDRKQELLDAALTEFIEYSYGEASLNNIIKNAGISKGTFYYHFADKQALYLSLIQGTVDAKMEFLERRLKDYVHDDDMNIFETLKLQARFGIEFAIEKPKYYLLGMMFLKEKGNKIYDAVMDMLDNTTESYYDSLIEKAMSRGDLREGLSPAYIKRMLTYLLYHYDEIFDIKREELDFDQMIANFNQLIDFIWHGLGADQSQF